MDPSRAPRSLLLRLAGGRGAGGESEGAAGATKKANFFYTSRQCKINTHTQATTSTT